jgi:MFS family permease
MKNQKISAFGLIVWAVTVIFYLYEFILQVSPGVLLKPLMTEFSLSATAASQIGAIYFFTYALMQIPAGILLDRYGPKKILTVAAMFCTAGTFLMALAPSFNFVLLARFLTALGSAVAMIGSMKIVSNWFDKDRFALFSGLILLVGMLGAVFAKAPLAYSVEHIGWQNTLLYLGFTGILVTILNLTMIQNSPKAFSQQSISGIEKFHFADLKVLVSSYKTWLAAVYGGLMLTPVLSLGTLWGEKYLTDSYSYSNIESAAAMTFIFIGMGLGGPLGGWLSNIFNKKKSLMMLSSICAFTFLLLYIYISHRVHVYYYIIGFFLGLSTSLSWTVFAFVKELHPKKLHATALAFVNLITMLLGATGQLLIGVILDTFFEKQMLNGQAVYLESSYEYAFIIFPVFVCMAFAITFFLKEANR